MNSKENELSKESSKSPGKCTEKQPDDLIRLQTIPLAGLPEDYTAGGTLTTSLAYENPDTGKTVEINLKMIPVPLHILSNYFPIEPSALPKTPERQAQEAQFMARIQEEVAAYQEEYCKETTNCDNDSPNPPQSKH